MRKMNSNLPLLFANGFPTSIKNATKSQLQRFIPFLVQCSIGRDTTVFNEPKWWPEQMPLITPDTKPTCNEEEWLDMLRDLVIKCYKFHDCEYLLHFCNDLTTHHRSTLRYINNFNGTTSLYVKGEGKLLCTFRNENITYDKKEEDSRKCLKPRIINAIKILDDDDDDEMVTTEAVDIFICENCSIELESLSDLQNHERVCGINDDTDSNINIIADNNQTNFLEYFKLSSINELDYHKRKYSASPIKPILKLPHRTRNYSEVKQLKEIAFSSPAGKVLHKRLKLDISKEAIKERLSKIEKNCPAPDLNIQVPKYLGTSHKSMKTYRITYKEKSSGYKRLYRFPIGHTLSKNYNSTITYLASTNAHSQTDNSQQIKKVDSVIDLCSSDDEDYSEKTKVKEFANLLLNKSNEFLKSENEVVPLSIVCRSDNIRNIFPLKNIMEISESSSRGSSDCIDLCSSDEESILPDLPNYPHISIVRIPLGPRLTS